jgi:predicted proteasome-type protease
MQVHENHFKMNPDIKDAYSEMFYWWAEPAKILVVQEASPKCAIPRQITNKIWQKKKKGDGENISNIFSKKDTTVLKIQIYRHWGKRYAKCQFQRKQDFCSSHSFDTKRRFMKARILIKSFVSVNERN